MLGREQRENKRDKRKVKKRKLKAGGESAAKFEGMISGDRQEEEAIVNTALRRGKVGRYLCITQKRWI